MDINLMPKPVSRAVRMRTPVRGRWPWIVMGGGIVVVCAAAVVVAHLAVARSASSLNQLQQQVQLLQAQTQSISTSQSAQEAVAAQQVAQSATHYDVILRALAKDVSESSTVDSIQQTESTLTLVGRTNSVASVADFEADLLREPFVSSASFTAAALQTSGTAVPGLGQASLGHAIVTGSGGANYRYDYTLTVVLKSGGGAP
ncbi:PilN domain-containing protein [Alicyclobacillus sendaiensis]|uniref:PilN domain-containing protein n=1 Tax=Alicyclobacillus sendaiensis TaxID=192387 RepID=UPI0026F4115E|nr:PilN domain-containing protein [Alicyclobacillus sendaiensis]